MKLYTDLGPAQYVGPSVKYPSHKVIELPDGSLHRIEQNQITKSPRAQYFVQTGGGRLEYVSNCERTAREVCIQRILDAGPQCKVVRFVEDDCQ